MTVHDDGRDQPTTTFRTDLFDESGFTAGPMPTAAAPADDEDPRRTGTGQWHGGLDVGLLVLRLALGATMVAHGLQKFGLFGGPGIGGFADLLTTFGYTGQTTVLAWVTVIAEVAGGLLLVIGLFTPLGAAAILGVTANVVYAKFSGGFFAGQGEGFEFELLLAVVAFALLFTGSGRAALDKNTPWRRRPLPLGLVSLVLAAAAAIVVIVLFR